MDFLVIGQSAVTVGPDRGRSIVFLTGEEGQLITPSRHPHQAGDREKNGGRHDAGGHEAGWRRAKCGIEPAALAKAKLHLRSYFLRMRRGTCGLCATVATGSGTSPEPALSAKRAPRHQIGRASCR